MITSVLLHELLLLVGGEARRGSHAIQCYYMRLEEEQRRPQPDTVHRLRPRPAVARRGLREIWGDMGRYGEIWGDMGDMGRYGEVWGDDAACASKVETSGETMSSCTVWSTRRSKQ